ncbi:MAG: T9SS type A sorting domain-containing protein [Ignavibacteriae bacterium]|nr:T9SS type A sorting domain-containing protein [Ignavibacteriota bacterium]
MQKLFISQKIILISVFSVLTFNFCNCQWIISSNGFGNNNFVYSLLPVNNSIFMGSTGVYISTNNGNYWSQTTFDSLSVSALALKENTIFACTYTNGVHYSTNYGSTWLQTQSSFSDIWSLTVSGNNIIAGTTTGLYLTSNNGQNWNQNALTNIVINTLISDGNIVFAGTYYNGVYKSTNYGFNWVQTSLNNQTVWSFAINGSNLYAGTRYNGIFLSTNNGTDWIQTGMNNQTVLSIALYGANILAGTYQNGVFYSTNNGISWNQKNDGFSTTPSINSLLIFNNFIFAGTQGQSIWKRLISDFVTVQNVSQDLPGNYLLKQNYPNPFNPNTNIGYNIKQNSEIKIVIYDLLGKEISIPVNEKQSPGEYEFNFDGSALNSGIYFYSLYVNGKLIENKRMVLLK